MSKKAKKYLIATITSIIMMFVWIFITVFLTGGKEISEFTSTDISIFIAFILLEIITCIVMFIFATKAGKENYKNNTLNPPVPKTKYDKAIQRRGWILSITAFLLALFVMVFGMIVGKNIRVSFHVYITYILAFCCSVPILLVPLNLLLQKRYNKRIEQTQVRDLQQYVYSHRDSAEYMAAKKYTQIKKLRIATNIYTICLAFFAFGTAFCTGILYTTDMGTTFCMLSALFFLAALSRIRFPVPKIIFDEDHSYISVSEYPQLYNLAKKAADTLHCEGNIRIAILDNFNAGIARIGNTYSVQLGAILLNTVSQEELYSILLHEFSHMASENDSANKEMDYNTWICNGTNPHYLSRITSSLFCYLDTVYNLQFSLYQYASSLLNETTADRAMVTYGSPVATASALLKIKYYNLYLWEKGTYDEECLFAPEKPNNLLLTTEIESFKHAMKLRMNEWNYLVNVEILSRNASHPTLKMRLEALGITSYQILETINSDAYNAECSKTLQYVEELIYQERIKTYEETRKMNYFNPKQMVETWEASGKPVIAEEYADINFALRQLGRNTEALELCDRAISELSSISEKCYAYYIKGCFLLHQFDASGLDYIYHAIENNKNYIDEGLAIIGEFCCITGNQKELDIFREKAIELAQKKKDVYYQIGELNKTDQLTAEQLPDGMLNEILSYISTIDEECIQSIYLVRKTITSDFFTSVFVIRFDVGTSDETQEKIMHKIFSYLDTCSNWQFSLFNYLDVADVKIEKIANSCVYTKNS